MRFAAAFWLVVFLALNMNSDASELPELDRTALEVHMIRHPGSGREMLILTEPGQEVDAGWAFSPRTGRPDYRLLDPKVDPDTVEYAGPVSDRRKVYMLAASLVAAGAVTSVVLPAAFPAAAGSAGGSSGAVTAGGGAALAGGAAAARHVLVQEQSHIEDYAISDRTDFERLYPSALAQ